MEPDRAKKRKEVRYPIEIEAAVEAASKHQEVPATTVNLSVSGVQLLFKGPPELMVGDEVTCEFKFVRGSDKPLPCWGVGSVVRVDGSTVGIELSASTFVASEPDPAIPPIRVTPGVSEPGNS